MKKWSFILFCLLTGAALTGCQTAGYNPAGVRGATAARGGASELGYGTIDPNAPGSLSMTDRFRGGTEHPDQFAPVLFAYDSSQVGPLERGKIEAVYTHLRKNPAQAVIVEGHTDERGSREYNLALGERRALAVRSYLAELGIEPERIQTKSLGEEQPASTGHDAPSRALNRRSEFVLYY